ncbi:hypothetical protein [Tatumella ptyseos]|uniref:Bifunctional protein BirA n=1 Tax=Tatumella ptyseos TaxID=82987 RepID=A0A2X5NE36_9GAMM|nr:hypothetical protein [Tatumella ptyseos]SQK71788.1 Bifunctional protein BirA [Tatumella ptyseos]
MMRNVDDSVVNQQWISLQEAGITIDRNALTVALINKMREALTLFETEGLAPFIDRWASLDNFINRPVKLVIGEREIHGVARGLTAGVDYYWNRKVKSPAGLGERFPCVRFRLNRGGRG